MEAGLQWIRVELQMLTEQKIQQASTESLAAQSTWKMELTQLVSGQQTMLPIQQVLVLLYIKLTLLNQLFLLLH